MQNINEKSIIVKIIESWATTNNPFNSTEEILKWVDEKNKSTIINISKINYQYDGFWYYDKQFGGIKNRNDSFFQIKGLINHTQKEDFEQPIIIQNEIGYLGIICKEINGVLYFLMQAKIEPGNVNKIQISPTIQATKSNFMQTHGGKAPAYLEYFTNKDNYEIIVDQIQSEQSARFLGKRNRNIIIIVNDDIEVIETHKWMTLGQIKELMSYDNLVNMDTRTVVSCIPFSLREFSDNELSYIKTLFTNEYLYNSIFTTNVGNQINNVYHYINDFKMLNQTNIELVDLYDLKKWEMVNGEYVSSEADFKVVFCNIEIDGREIRKWQQPLIEAIGQSVFGLIYCIENQTMKFLVHAKTEVGCFDRIEIGPSIQRSSGEKIITSIDKYFNDKLLNNNGIDFQGIFSEEGGRFYHEQNKNVIMRVNKDDFKSLPNGYFWIDYKTANTLIQFNNCLNIQLRNLFSIINL